ncbi:MAG: DnaJ domain-containing protein [Brumimicrobium sp.]
MKSAKYFKILGISPTKDIDVIKKAYRKKAFKYHPDKNPSKEAHESFILITEAYDNLIYAIEQDKKAASTSREAKEPFTTETQRDRDLGDLESRMRRARARYEFLKKREKEEELRYYESLITGKTWKRYKILMFSCLLFSFLSTVDYLFLPTSLQESYMQKANSDIKFNGLVKSSISPVMMDTGDKIWGPEKLAKYHSDAVFHIEKTFLFKDVKHVHFLSEDKWQTFTPDYSFIIIFPFIQLVLLIPAVIYFMKSNTFAFKLSFNLAFYIFTPLIVFALVSNNRWLHIITFGLL